MILCIDCGNSRLKWGVRNLSAQWGALGAHPLAGIAEAFSPEAVAGVVRVVACNVAGPQVAAALEARLKVLGLPFVEWLVPSVAAAGVSNGYRVPTQLGADRWAAMLGARAVRKHATLVVLAGTATTVDMLDEDGQFIGGVILPGVDLMFSALARNTAQLPLAKGAFATAPDNTDDAITSGVLDAQVGAIERRFAQLRGDERQCLLAGGAADLIAPLLSIPCLRKDDLVLLGLACWAECLP